MRNPTDSKYKKPTKMANTMFVARDSDMSAQVTRAKGKDVRADGRWQIAVNTLMIPIRSQRINEAVTSECRGVDSER